MRIATSAHGYRFGGERFRHSRAFRDGNPRQHEAALLERLAATPIEEWSDEDMRAVLRSTPYLNPRTPGHADWQARVRSYFERRFAPGQGATEDEDCTGVARVRAHTRRGANGPIQVSAHDRAVPCG